MWQAEAVKELTLSASPATAVGEQTLTLANRRYSTVHFKCEEKISKFAQNKAVIVFWLSCKILFFTNRNHAFGAAEGLFQSFSPKYWMIFTHKTLILDSLSLGLEQNHSILELILKKP